MGFKDKCLEDSLISCSFSKIIVVHSSLGPMISLTVDSWPALQYKAVTCTSKNSWLLYYIVTIITPMGMSHQIDRNHSFQILHLGKRADEFSPQAPGIVLSGTKKANYQDESFQVTSSLIFFFLYLLTKVCLQQWGLTSNSWWASKRNSKNLYWCWDLPTF